MCRNIRPLYNFEPPATPDEIEAAARQFVRKVSGFHKPSRLNQEPMEEAVQEIAAVVHKLLEQLNTTAPPRNRDAEAAKARRRARF